MELNIESTPVVIICELPKERGPYKEHEWYESETRVRLTLDLILKLSSSGPEAGIGFRSCNRTDCELCSLISEVAQTAVSRKHEVNRDIVGDEVAYIDFPLPFSKRHTVKQLSVFSSALSKAQPFLDPGLTHMVLKDGSAQVRIGLAARHESHASNFVARRVVENPHDPLTVQLMKFWLARCETHPSCSLNLSGTKIDPSPKLPTRVLDVTDGIDRNGLRLHIANGQRDTYAVLSHCWGGKVAVQTTRRSIAKHTVNIPYADLPPTFRDAVCVTRKLGFRYLWIDSLCIVQDDLDDWNREAKNMGDIFEQATVTIAATRSPDSETGFLQPYTVQPTMDSSLVPNKETSSKRTRRRVHSGKPQPQRKRILLPWACDPDDADKGEMYLTNMPRGNAACHIEKARLNSRGWVVQERLLSRRILHFADDQLYWECKEEFVAQDGYRQSRQSQNGEGLAGLTASIANLAHMQPDRRIRGVWEDFEKNQFFEDLWIQIIQAYSACDFTYSADRIPALLGLVDRLKPLTNLSFRHGHWFEPSSGKLPRSLFWTAVSPGRTKPDSPRLHPFADLSFKHGHRVKPPPGKLPRSLFWSALALGRSKSSLPRAPSWSWAALEGKVAYNRCRSRPCVTLLSPLDQSEPDDHTTLRISGRLLSVAVMPDDYSQRVASIIPRRGKMKQWEGESVGTVTFDFPGRLANEFECLLLYTDDNGYSAVLALDKVGKEGGEGVFWRIGYGTLGLHGLTYFTEEETILRME